MKTRSLVAWGVPVALVLAGGLLVYGPLGSSGDADAQRRPAGSAGAGAATNAAPRRLPHTVLRSIPHPAPSFTEGLLWHQGSLFESVGPYGESEVRELDATTGVVRQRRTNAQSEFGEGLALQGDVLVQLTWHEGYALRLQRAGLTPATPPRWTYQTEGWGLTWMPDRQHFARSDGSARIRFHNGTDFTEDGGIEVRRAGVALRNINELEYARGHLYANVWGTEAQHQRILEVDPASGAVTAEVDLHDLCAQEHVGPDHELNGIAYNPEENVFYVTGKRWERIYVLRW